MEKAVVLFSGGLDSTTCLGYAINEGYDVYPISFNYGQKHSKEIDQAKKIVEYYHLKNHKIVDISFLKEIGGSSLTDDELNIFDNENATIPNTYVPARNLVFLSMATSYAEAINAKNIFIGVSSIDYSGYPDCRPEFIDLMNYTINAATSQGNFKINTPLINLSKKKTILLGNKIQVPYHLTTSCYQGDQEACGICESCRLRIKGFKELGIEDPIKYKKYNGEKIEG